MATAGASIERSGRTALVRVRGDVTVATAHLLYGSLRPLPKRRDLKKAVIDFSEVGRLDSSGVAVVRLVKDALERAGKELELAHLAPHHQAAFRLAPPPRLLAPPRDEGPGWLESIGDRVLGALRTLRGAAGLLHATGVQSWHVGTRRRRLPAGSFTEQAVVMGADAVFIVGLLVFLVGMTIAFQGAIQLAKVGAAPWTADMVAWSMVREFAPLITAIILTGRTGAAIAAELGTMRVGSEIDALVTMGVSPIRYLVVPRLLALTVVVPALTLIAMFIGIMGGFLVMRLTIAFAASAFWVHILDTVTLGDFVFGLGKSVVFAQIIGISATYLGLNAGGDAGSVGRATTRTVVVSVFLIIVVDAVFATLSTLGDPP